MFDALRWPACDFSRELQTKTFEECQCNPAAVTVVGPDLTVPLEGLLAGDLPEVALAAPVQGLALAIQESGANPVGRVVVALEVAISGALARAHGDVAGHDARHAGQGPETQHL